MNNQNKPQFLIAAPASGSGKTSICMGLMALLTRKGYTVQPFKCGPDYIDTQFHEIATGKPAVNLDAFMASEEHIKELYACYAHSADICMVEGMMGLFDGYNKRKGSSAEIARILGIPVILVVDAKSTSYSVAPLIHGFKSFDPSVQLAGVIFNRVGSERHETMLKEACIDAGVEYLGSIRRNENLKLGSRYLGLDISPESNKETVKNWADFIEEQINIDELREKMMRPVTTCIKEVKETSSPKLRIAVARNRESFAFIYEETLSKFREWGEVVFFDPETTKRLPHHIDLLYLPGGYPEKRLKELSLKFNDKDELLRDNIYNDIREYIENGGRTLAECGGMIYLSEGVYTDDGYTGMLNVLPFAVTAEKEKKHLTLGYRQFEYNGQQLRGHEFHYTQICRYSEPEHSVTQVYNAMGQPVDTPVFRYKNVIASYTHLYVGETDIMQLWNDNQNA